LNGTKKDSLKFEHLPNFSPIPKMIGAKPRQLVRFNVGYVCIFPFEFDNEIFSRDSFLNSKLKYFLGPDRSYEYLTMGLKEELALFFDQLFTLNRCIEFGAGSNPHIREQVGLQLNSLYAHLAYTEYLKVGNLSHKYGQKYKGKIAPLAVFSTKITSQL
jgi:hypothetical protein